MNKQEKASRSFDSGYNCAQSVLLAFADELKLDESIILKIASGFGGGMARMQDTCGAVAGGIMAIGMAVSNEEEDIATNKERVYYTISLFINKFKEKYSSVKCLDLLNCDLNTEEGQQFYEKHELHHKVCMSCVSDATAYLEELLKKFHSK
ncbi:MAG: C-GCAxxG-C-C family protein [Bacteroidales bacterium]|jgi:C_GCAxxG_C_C family probable redox protein